MGTWWILKPWRVPGEFFIKNSTRPVKTRLDSVKTRLDLTRRLQRTKEGRKWGSVTRERKTQLVRLFDLWSSSSSSSCSFSLFKLPQHSLSSQGYFSSSPSHLLSLFLSPPGTSLTFLLSLPFLRNSASIHLFSLILIIIWIRLFS